MVPELTGRNLGADQELLSVPVLEPPKALVLDAAVGEVSGHLRGCDDDSGDQQKHGHTTVDLG